MGITISDILPIFNKIWDRINILTVSSVDNTCNIHSISQLIPNKILALFELLIAVQVEDLVYFDKTLNLETK